MPYSLLLHSWLALSLFSLIHADTGPNEMVCDAPIIARLPPSISTVTNPQFVDTPRGYFSGLCYDTYSSTSDSDGVKNAQLLSVYNKAADVTSDLTSFQIGSCDHIFTTFATDADSPRQDDNYPLHLPGNNISVVADVVTYGLDTGCHRYFVTYEAPPGSGLVICSQVEDGPTDETVSEIKKALIALGSPQLTALVKALGKIATDGARSGLADFICDEACLTNQNGCTGTCPS